MKQQGVIGDATQIPKTQVDKKELAEEEHLAEFSRTKEFERLKEFLEARIKYYQKFLPGSEQPLRTTNIQEKDLPMYWKIACTVVEEFENVLNAYESAREAVDKKNG